MVRIIEKPRDRVVNKTAVLLFDRLELLIIWIAIALIPIWAWPVWGSFGDTKNFLIFILVPFLFGLELIRTIYINRGVGFGFLFNRLNLILCAPAALVFVTWAMAGFRIQKFFGWDAQWFDSVLPVFLLVVWHFTLRSYFENVDKRIFLRFTWLLSFVMALIFSAMRVKSLNPDFYNISWFFILWTFLALCFSLMEIPFFRAKAGVDLGALSYPVIVSIAAGFYFYFGFIFNMALAGSEFQRGRFDEALKLNPHHPEYILAYSREQIDDLVQRYGEEDQSKLKQEVAFVVANLSKLNGVVEESDTLVRTARAYAKLFKLVEGAQNVAKKYYDAAVARDNKNEDLLKEVLIFYRVSLKDHESGLKLADYALAINSGNSAFIIEKALILEAMNKPEDALAFLKQKKGGDLEVDYHYGRVLYNLGKFEEARDVFLDILSKDPNYADANYSIGVYYYKSGEYAKALKYFEKVRENNPENQDIAKKIQETKSKLGR